MITGYKVGTEVKWTVLNTFETGIIEAVYYSPTDVVIDRQTFHVAVSNNSPSYLVARPDGSHVVLAHQEVMMNSTNFHTGRPEDLGRDDSIT